MSGLPPRTPTYDELKKQAAAQRVQLDLIETAARSALEKGHAFGSELRLAQRIIAILEHRL